VFKVIANTLTKIVEGNEMTDWITGHGASTQRHFGSSNNRVFCYISGVK